MEDLQPMNWDKVIVLIGVSVGLGLGLWKGLWGMPLVESIGVGASIGLMLVILWRTELGSSKK